MRMVVILMHFEVTHILGHFANSLPKRYVHDTCNLCMAVPRGPTSTQHKDVLRLSQCRKH